MTPPRLRTVPNEEERIEIENLSTNATKAYLFAINHPLGLRSYSTPSFFQSIPFHSTITISQSPQPSPKSDPRNSFGHMDQYQSTLYVSLLPSPTSLLSSSGYSCTTIKTSHLSVVISHSTHYPRRACRVSCSRSRSRSRTLLSAVVVRKSQPQSKSKSQSRSSSVVTCHLFVVVVVDRSSSDPSHLVVNRCNLNA
jgi:hypothetical protein